MMTRLKFSWEYLFVFLVLLGAFIVRLYKIDNPIADWHSWRQADTAAVSRNFYKEGFNPFIPKYDDMSGVAEHPVVNLNRYRFVEFPIYNSLVYFAYLLNGGVDERLARLIAVFFSLGSTLFIYLITKKYFKIATAMLSTFFYAFLPYNIYFSRVVLPEPSLVFFSLGMFYFVSNWIETNKKSDLTYSLFFIVLAFLTKPYAGVYALPLVYLFFTKEHKFWPIPKRYWILALGIIPFLLWRIWIEQHPEGIPASNWLFNGNGIRFKPAFFKWIIGDRFGREILGPTGTFLFFLGLLIKPRLNQNWLLHVLAVASFLYLIVLATGNVQHDYYQYLIIPALVIFLARGAVFLMEGVDIFIPRLWTLPLAVLFIMLTLYLTWNEVKGLYQINNGVIVEAGQEADKILPKDAIVLAPYNGDTSFLYQTNRHGWANQVYPIDDMIKLFGVQYLVSVNFDDQTNAIMKQYKIIEKTQKFVIVDLTQKNSTTFTQ